MSRLKTCPDCGVKNDEGAQFCRTCDAYLVWEAGDEEPAGRSIEDESASSASEAGGDSDQSGDIAAAGSGDPIDATPSDTRPEASASMASDVSADADDEAGTGELERDETTPSPVDQEAESAEAGELEVGEPPGRQADSSPASDESESPTESKSSDGPAATRPVAPSTPSRKRSVRRVRSGASEPKRSPSPAPGPAASKPGAPSKKPRPSYRKDRAKRQARNRAKGQVRRQVSGQTAQLTGGLGGSAAPAAQMLRSAAGKRLSDANRERSLRRGFNRAMRSAADGKRVGYDRSLVTRVLISRSVLVSLVVLLLIAGFSPWRRPVVAFAGDQIARFLPGVYEDIEIVSISTALDDDANTGFNPRRAIDGFSNTAWSARLPSTDTGTDSSDPPECSDAAAGRATVDMQFDEATRVDRVTVVAGVDPDLAGAEEHGRPQILDIVFIPQIGEVVRCEQVQLQDTFEPQDHDIADVREVIGARLHIRRAHPAEDAGSQQAALTEVIFSRR